MVFDYTPRERARIENQEKKMRDFANGGLKNLQALQDAKLGDVMRDPDGSEALRLFFDQYSAYEKTFFGILEDIEAKRFSKLTTPADVLEDAKKQIQMALVYLYASATKPRPKITIDGPAPEDIKEIVDNIYQDLGTPFLDTWDRESVVYQFMAKEWEVTNGWKLQGADAINYIREHVVDKHLKALAGTPQQTVLELHLLEIAKTSISYEEAMARAAVLYRQPEKYRTKTEAKKAGAITQGPENLIIPTLPEYQYSMSLYSGKGGAYLQPLNNMENLQFKNGSLYFADAQMREVSEAELRDLRTKEGINNLDLMSLRLLYSILFAQFQQSGYKVLQDQIIVSVPVLAQRDNPNKEEINAVLEKIKSYHNVMGVIKNDRNGRSRESYYQVLNFEYYDDKRNIVAFSSPYMNYVIKNAYSISIKRNSKGEQITKKDGTPVLSASHSYLIASDLAKERNKAAAENVVLLVETIERAGGKGAHIKAKELVKRNVQLADRLQKDPEHATQLLGRVFKKTWELLRTRTRLLETYDDIQLPDPNDPASIPTMSTLDSTVFTITHNGKKTIT